MLLQQSLLANLFSIGNISINLMGNKLRSCFFFNYKYAFKAVFTQNNFLHMHLQNITNILR